MRAGPGVSGLRYVVGLLVAVSVTLVSGNTVMVAPFAVAVPLLWQTRSTLSWAVLTRQMSLMLNSCEVKA
jgi:hypothetical protein